MGIETIEPLAEILGAGLPTEIGVRVRNFGSVGRAGVRIALSIDGQRQPSQKVDVAARATAQVVFPVVFERPGFHALEADILNCELNAFALDAADALVEQATVQLVPAAGQHASF